MSTYELLLLAHIGSVVVLAAAVGASVTCKLAALRARSALVVDALVETAGSAVRRVGVPASLVLIVAGVGLVHASKGAWSLHEPWIVGAFALWLGSGVVGARMHAPRSRRVRALAQRLAGEGGEVTDELRELVRGGLVASVLDVALFAGMIALMVLKPG